MINNTDKYNSFREQYQEFIYRDYTYQQTDSTIDIQYHFEIEGLAEFRPTWSISILNKGTTVDKKTLDTLIFSLGMVELVSYWKLACPPNITIQVGNLTEDQIQWWQKLYTKGLGEFLYINGITPADDFINIIPNKSLEVFTPQSSNITTSPLSNQRTLIPIGGGKDSTVTVELLNNHTDRYCYIINPRGATTETVDVANLTDKTIIAKRILDKKMIELNKEGFLNGHTPFSAIVAFSSVIAAYVNGITNVALSNESSANESTVENTDVNHQYSKSYEFELDFINYESKYINSTVKYFSMLRPISELQIAKLFSELKQYHSVFKSCNVGSKENIWCCNCPKCLFVYIILSPFLEEDELLNIFGKNMLDNSALQEDFDKLIGLTKEKPFECVGSRDEVNIALQMTINNFTNNNKQLPFLLQYYNNQNFAPIDATDILTQFDDTNSVPTAFSELLKIKISGGI